MKITVLVKPKSKESKIVSYDGIFLTVKISAIPRKGASNIELIKLLSRFFNVPMSKIAIVSGFKSKIKNIIIEDCKNKLNLALKKLL